MNSYKLKFADDCHGLGKQVEFDGIDANDAFEVARQEKPGRTMELWQGERRLCTIMRTGVSHDIWRIAS